MEEIEKELEAKSIEREVEIKEVITEQPVVEPEPVAPKKTKKVRN